MVRLPARMRTWGKRGYGLLEDRVVVLGRFDELGLSQSFRDLGARRRLGAQSAVLRRVS